MGGIHKPRGQVGGGRGSLNCPCQSTRGEGGSRTWSTWTKLLFQREVFSCIFLKKFLKKKFPSQKLTYLVYEHPPMELWLCSMQLIVIFVRKNLPKNSCRGGGGGLKSLHGLKEGSANSPCRSTRGEGGSKKLKNWSTWFMNGA